MKTSLISTVLSLLLIALSSAQSPNLAYFTLSGGIVFTNSTYGIYPNYTLTVPRDSHPLPIRNSLVVYEIIPVDSSGHLVYNSYYNCDFLGGDGAVTHMGPTQDVDGPQVQVSVTCFGNATSSASGNATGTSVSATVLPSSSGPPYSTATVSSSSTAGGAAASASAGLATKSATAGMGSATVMPFTGDAMKSVSSAGGFFLACVLGLVAAAM